MRWLVVEEGQTKAGALGEPAQVRLPLGRPTSTADVETADALDGVTVGTQAEGVDRRAPLAVQAERRTGGNHGVVRRRPRLDGAADETERSISIVAPYER